MTDKEEEKKNLATSSGEAPLLPAKLGVCDPNADRAVEFHRVPTKGEKWFDFLQHRVLNFAVNEGISLWLTDLLVYGRLKHKTVQWSESLARTFNKSKPHDVAVKDYRGLVLTFILNNGGNFLLIPMKIMEAYKGKIVQKLNHFSDMISGDKPTPAEIKIRDAEVAHHLSTGPKLTWGALLASRIASVGLNLGLNKFVIGGKRTQQIEDITGKAIVDLTKVPNVGMMNRLADHPRFQGLSKLLVLETMYCANASYSMQFLNKFFSKKPHGRTNITNSDPKANAGTISAPSFTEKLSAEAKPERVITPRSAKEKQESFASAVQKTADGAELTLGA